MEHGVTTMTKRNIDHQAVAALYQTGQSISKVAAHFGVDDEAVRYALKKLGIARRPRGGQPGAENHQFKGGSRVRADGYRLVRGTREKPLDHRVLAEKALGRRLKKHEVVHHINCNRSDNRPENLLVCSDRYHRELHVRMSKHPYWNQF